MSYDPQHQLIYLPTGSASNDTFGGTRPGDNRNANSLCCLDANTGVLKWAFQVVHHDLWDYDCPSEPLLFDFEKSGQTIPAVALSTKMGRVFLFNRLTGQPLFPIKEVPVPKSDVPGEVSWPTQPLETLPPPLVPQSFSKDNAWTPNGSDMPSVLHFLAHTHHGPIFTPPSIQGTIKFPGNYGGCNWAGMSYDGRDHQIVTTTTNAPFGVQLVKSTPAAKAPPFPMIGAPYYETLGEAAIRACPSFDRHGERWWRLTLRKGKLLGSGRWDTFRAYTK